MTGRKVNMLIALAMVGAAFATAAVPDSIGDGAPDYLRLDREQDRGAFRRWFTFLAEVQYFNRSGMRPAEIVDCSSLLRDCYREALRKHDSCWATDARLPLVPAFRQSENIAIHIPRWEPVCSGFGPNHFSRKM